MQDQYHKRKMKFLSCTGFYPKSQHILLSTSQNCCCPPMNCCLELWFMFNELSDRLIVLEPHFTPRTPSSPVCTLMCMRLSDYSGCELREYMDLDRMLKRQWIWSSNQIAVNWYCWLTECDIKFLQLNWKINTTKLFFLVHDNIKIIIDGIQLNIPHFIIIKI